MTMDKSSIAHAWRICIYCIAYPSPRSKTILTCTVALFILNHLTAATQLVVVEYKMSFSILFLRTTLFLSLLFIKAGEISSNSGDQHQTDDDEFSKILIAVFIATCRQLPTAARAIPVPFNPPPVAAQPAIINNAQTNALQQEPNPADIVYVPLIDLLPPPTAAAAPPATENGIQARTVDVSSSHLQQMELEVTKHFLLTFIPIALLVLFPSF